MLRLAHCIRLRYLAAILGWVGYASGLSAAPLQLESTPLFLNVTVHPVAQGRSSIALMMIMRRQTVVSVARTRVFMVTHMG